MPIAFVVVFTFALVVAVASAFDARAARGTILPATGEPIEIAKPIGGGGGANSCTAFGTTCTYGNGSPTNVPGCEVTCPTGTHPICLDAFCGTTAPWQASCSCQRDRGPIIADRQR